MAIKHKHTESKTDDVLKYRFLEVRKEIFNRYTAKQQNEQQAANEAFKRSMTDRQWESEVMEIYTDITAPGASKKTNRTVTDLLIKNPSHEDFVAAWSEEVHDKGLTFHFFSDPLVRKAILVTVQCADSIITFSSTHGKDTVLPRRNTWTAKILPVTDDRLQQEVMWVKRQETIRVKIVYSRRTCGQETISAKRYDVHDENHHDHPEGAFTQRNMNRSK